MNDTLTQAVKAKYGAEARRVAQGKGNTSCCGPDAGPGACCGPATDARDAVTRDLYAAGQTAVLPAEAIAASLGCGNPTALAALHPGETVLDLGSGGGIDVLLSARRVGPTGWVFGLDMTDDMLALAQENQQRAGVKNVTFLKGHIEEIPLPNNSVDVIISNCVINLSGDKDRVLAEAFRVLKPGGRFAVSDIVGRRPVPAIIQKSLELWTGCIAGALEEGDYRARLQNAGFTDIEFEPTRVYHIDDARTFLEGAGLDRQFESDVDGAFMSAFIRARKL